MNHIGDIISRMRQNMTQEDYPGVVEGLVPEKISYLQVKQKLQEVLKEKGNIRDLIHVLEEMEENI